MLYFSRYGTLAARPDGIDGEVASYRGPLGRLAEMGPGRRESIRVPSGEHHFEVDERALVRPVLELGLWNARDTVVESTIGAATVASLRQIIQEAETERASDGVGGDEFAQVEAQARRAHSVAAGVRRQLIDRMSLRDQPVLDAFQGEVFRRPLDSRIFLVGPPGTGKTTTLIRRLAQKRCIEELDADERDLIQEEEARELIHDDNWLMFAPTELLKLYLKEAFAREGVAASDARVRTWVDERRRLSREVLRILRSPEGGHFVLDDDAVLLVDESSRRLIDLSEAFSRFLQVELADAYAAAREVLGAAPQQEARAVASLLDRRLGDAPITIDRILGLADIVEDVNRHRRSLLQRVETAIRREASALMRRVPHLLPDLAAHLQSIESPREEDIDDELEGEDPSERLSEEGDLLAARALQGALRSYALSVVQGRSISSDSRAGRVLSWLGDRAPTASAIREVGQDLAALRQIGFVSAVRRHLVDAVPRSFQRFRRSDGGDAFYRNDVRAAVDRWRISQAEVDIIVLEMLRNTRRLEGRLRSLSPSDRARVEQIRAERTTQVLVDEAADFSPVQLACMRELAHPRFRSLFMCGDLRQRITRFGLQSVDELKWVDPQCELVEIRVGYRQSRALASLADAVANLAHLEPPRVTASEFNEGPIVRPLLAERVVGDPLAHWLTDRLLEIERAVGRLPSTAIFVPDDEQIDPLVDLLRPLLRERNLEVVGCPEGRVVGTDAQVRVFDVQYIKGLEFESVFFVGVDQLVLAKPDLFDKFLFLGITRAATYLGLTCAGSLPASLEPLRPLLSAEDWRRRTL